MKKVLLFFVVAVLATLSSCDPESNSWQWKIKNTTDQTLKLKYFSYMPHVPAYVTAVIPPGESILLYKAGREKVSFNHYFEECANLYGENVYWQILSDDDIVLKTWHYSDNGLPD